VSERPTFITIGLVGVVFVKDKKIRSTYPRNSFTQWYRVVVDYEISDFKRQIEEVDELVWVDKQDLRDDLNLNPNKYIPAMPNIIRTIYGQ
jgi:hypothetical protein